MADPAAGSEEEHSRFISSSALEWTTKPVTGFLHVCNEPILSSEVSSSYLATTSSRSLSSTRPNTLLVQEDEDVHLERRGDLLAPLKVLLSDLYRSQKVRHPPRCHLLV